MRRIVTIVILVSALLSASAASAFAQLVTAPMSPAEVVVIDRVHDGTMITVQGEAIGEHLRAMGGGRWVNILGDEVGLGIWVTDEMAAEIEYFGDYRHDGDVVRVTGILNVACEQHGGEFDVHARDFEIVERGGVRQHEVQPVKGLIGVAGLAAAFGLWRLYVKRRDRRLV